MDFKAMPKTPASQFLIYPLEGGNTRLADEDVWLCPKWISGLESNA